MCGIPTMRPEVQLGLGRDSYRETNDSHRDYPEAEVRDGRWSGLFRSGRLISEPLAFASDVVRAMGIQSISA
jgi:hypothetical protein